MTNLHGPGYFEQRQEPDKVLHISASTDVPLHKKVVKVSAGTDEGRVEATLPNAEEAAGYEFILEAFDLSGAGAAVLIHGSASTALSTTGVTALARSTGSTWVVQRV